MNKCKVSDCDREIKYKAKQLCVRHYKNYAKYGKPDGKFIRCDNSMSIEERLLFKSKINYKTGCIEFTGATTAAGYGMLSIKPEKKYAHILSWELHNKKSTNGFLVMHICDNPKCINPDHLKLGTDQDNMDDKVLKKRHCHGSRRPLSKLNEDKVKDIFSMLTEGKTQTSIASIYGISSSVISRIKNRKRWKHVEAPQCP